MSTKQSEAALVAALGKLPTEFRRRISTEFVALRQAMTSSQYDTVGVRAGRLAETLLRLLQQQLTGTHLPWSHKKLNMVQECLRLEQLPQSAGPESLRLIMPRALAFIYTLRNKRGMGHAAGDVDASEIDAATCVRVADWCICEIVRLNLAVSLEEAQALVDAIATRVTPEVWIVGGRRRVLVPGLDYKSQVLLLLHAVTDSGVLEEDVREWVEHPHSGNFRRDVLDPLHQSRFVEYQRDSGVVILSPTGAKEVESKIIPRLRGV